MVSKYQFRGWLRCPGGAFPVRPGAKRTLIPLAEETLVGKFGRLPVFQ
jgi:hypothetical protein